MCVDRLSLQLRLRTHPHKKEATASNPNTTTDRYSETDIRLVFEVRS